MFYKKNYTPEEIKKICDSNVVVKSNRRVIGACNRITRYMAKNRLKEVHVYLFEEKVPFGSSFPIKGMIDLKLKKKFFRMFEFELRKRGFSVGLIHLGPDDFREDAYTVSIPS